MKAVKYLKRADDQNDASGQLRYAERPENGIGVAQDTKKATEYFRLSADEVDADSDGKRPPHSDEYFGIRGMRQDGW
jgi:TPR repeat protein